MCAKLQNADLRMRSPSLSSIVRPLVSEDGAASILRSRSHRQSVKMGAFKKAHG